MKYPHVKVDLFISTSYLLLLCLTSMCMSQAAAAPGEFSFGVIANSFTTNPDESALRNAINDSDADNLAFVVANGIKSNLEPCSDKIYTSRKELFDSAQNGLIVSLAASDWSDCKNTHGRSAAIERLNRVRDLFFVDEFSFGASKIPLLRQSASPKFRSYGENARWEFSNIIFATLNLPANNNNYLAAAGRNSEFEDRLIANRDWLQRIVSYAARKKFRGIVLFCDGNPLAAALDKNNKRDGYVEMRRELIALAEKFPGKILLIYSEADPKLPANKTIAWQGNLGKFGISSGWAKLSASLANPALFSISDSSIAARDTRQ